MYCQKLKREAEPLEKAPFSSEMGQRIIKNISKEAWGLWLKQQTMIINENHLTLFEPEARALLKAEMEKFLFTDDAQAPEGYVPPVK
ncbi:FIG001341: Probable Fe(2+)-trafficking protein YggX [uncultured Candidatus Thioglobus sp.]|nr:MAG: oxidative damage protection protein [Cycloclasticus sp. symbiont of Poecilosclerida sp. N]SMN00662.1 FIG001341: Probable Fe(2+)-trafficking protein YggX [uncultured Candidatus Thioglobus sp.]